MSVTTGTDFAITDGTTAHVTERNEPPPTLVPKHEVHAAKALEEGDSTCTSKLRVFAQHVGTVFTVVIFGTPSVPGATSSPQDGQTRLFGTRHRAELCHC
jgi:hypothetical protein